MSQPLSYSMVRTVDIFTGPDIYSVPDYQRSYAWDSEVVEEFWEDILDAQKTAMKQYFLGTTLVIPRDFRGGSYYEIVDGQQRLATLCILMSVLREVLGSSQNPQKDRLCTKIGEHLTYVDPASQKAFNRVKLGPADDKYFSTHIIGGKSTIEAKSEACENDSQKRIFGAYSLLRDHTEEIRKKEGDQWLAQYYKYLTENVVMMSIKAAEDTEAFHVFESINARGTRLSHMDLLKSFFLARAGAADRRYVSEKWSLLVSRLTEQESFRFFRYYWMSRYELLRKFGFYRKVKQRVLNGLEPKDIVDALESESRIYEAITHPSNSWGVEVKRHLAALRSLGATQVHPILLSTARRFYSTSDQFSQMARAVTAFVVRKFVIGGERPGVFEKDAGRLARDLDTSEMNTAGVISSLRKMAPSDKDFRQHFVEYSVRSKRAAKYLLGEIEVFKSKTEEVEVLSSVDLEHILPKTPDAEWERKLQGKDHKEWVDRLGNLTIIDRGLNRGIQNKGFVVKQHRYQDSKIGITLELAENYADWGPTEIEKRQKEFARLAVRIWAISGSQ